MTSVLQSFTNSSERLISRQMYIDYCTIIEIDKLGTPGVKCHSPDHPEYYNTVSLKVRSTKANNTDPNAIQHLNALVLQHFVGNLFGQPYTPRVGDLVAVLFMYNNMPLVLGPVATIQQEPVWRGPNEWDAKYDLVGKWCQWLKPSEDENKDYYDHPPGKMPVCFKRFHGPPMGVEGGKGRDELTCWDCQKGNTDPTCKLCETIDSVPRSGEQWHKIYSTQTESSEAYNSRIETHARCGSYLRWESDDENEAGTTSSEYSEGIGHIRLGGAYTENLKGFHLNVQGKNVNGDKGLGTFDLHTNHEEVVLANETSGVRIAATHPEDDQVTWAYELMNFLTKSFVRCYKSGKLELVSCLDDDYSTITLDGTIGKITIDGSLDVDIKAANTINIITPEIVNITGTSNVNITSSSEINLTAPTINCVGDLNG